MDVILWIRVVFKKLIATCPVTNILLCGTDLSVGWLVGYHVRRNLLVNCIQINESRLHSSFLICRHFICSKL
jgi:hypothetical protein